ncbi:hypothetical protein M5689_013737 [Euphorbia peplus]|nr:hypothetical protein M5689_013737 [Euphorbia peplus]
MSSLPISSVMSYKPISNINIEIRERLGLLDYSCDIFGLLTKIGPINQFRSQDQIKTKRDVVLKNDSGEDMTITLWHTLAMSFPEEYILSIAEDKPIAIAFVAMIPKKTQDGFRLSGTSATKIFVNPNIPEISSFLQSIQKPYPKLQRNKQKNVQLMSIEEEKEANRKTIAELLEVDIHTDKEVKFTCKAKIKEIDPSEGWWYRACPTCKSGIQNFENKLLCKICGFIEDLPLPWYRSESSNVELHMKKRRKESESLVLKEK